MDDANSNKNDNNGSSSGFISTGAWTNEKHLHYLQSMEASFVRSVLQNHHNNSNVPPHRHHHLLRLDRYIPDTSDSTLDSISHRSKIHAAAVSSADIKSVEKSRSSRAETNNQRRRRSRSFQPYTSSSASLQQDQVVPQIGNQERR